MNNTISMTKSRVFIYAHALINALCLLVPLFWIPTVIANKGDTYSLNISMSGLVVANGTCKFDQGGTLQVDFGEVKLNAGENDTIALNGNYQRPLASNFTCTGDTAGLLQMKMVSSSGSYQTYNGTKVLTTDKGIVGIQLQVNDVAQNADEWFTVDPHTPPTLSAQLVQVSNVNSNNVTSGDTFTSSATLMLSFN